MIIIKLSEEIRMSFKKNVLFLAFVSVFGLSIPNVSSMGIAKKVAITACAAGAVVAGAHLYAFARDYHFRSLLYRRPENPDKYTWSFLEELFPSKYEMDRAEGDFHYLVQQNVKTFKPKYSADPLYLVTFVKDCEQDLDRLQSMKISLKAGATSSFGKNVLKKIQNETMFHFMQPRMDELYSELVRYEGRLRKIIHSVTNSYEYNVQLKMLYEQPTGTPSLDVYVSNTVKN